MTDEEIKKNAPIGATHYFLNYKNFKVYYFKKAGAKLVMWNPVKNWYSETSNSVSLTPL